ncbi:MAG: ATP-dependent helicase [Propionibacteriaceae bacterium]|jgi:superfamily I DNA/RNA helicase/RecB family exonuclease|nr:ATP-dependent helicase [Propionibacteriaceae bacterium]
MSIEPPVFRLVNRPIAAAPDFRPTDRQRQVMGFDGARLLVLGGPGSGKTAALVATAAAQLSARPDWRAVLVSPDRVGAEALRLDLARRAPAVWGRARVTTWHGLAFSLLRTADSARAWLSASQSDQRWRELIDQGGAAAWPAQLAQAWPTRRFARQTRQAVERLRQFGWRPSDLAARADAAGRPDWRALAGLWSDQADVKALHGDLDASDLMAGALAAVQSNAGSNGLGLDAELVLVDHFEEAEPGQIRLLEALAGAVARLIVFADPCQTVGGFRGARPAAVFDWVGSTAPAAAAVVELRRQHRLAPRLELVERRLRAGLARPRPGPDRAGRSLSGDQREDPVDPGESVVPVDPVGRKAARGPADPAGRSDWFAGAPPAAGSFEVAVCPSSRAEAELIAGRLSQWRWERGWDWSDMAVLVRSGGPIPALWSALTAAGLPVRMAWDEIPLAGQPAVVTLLTALRLCLEDDPTAAPGWIGLAASPLAGLEAADRAVWAAGATAGSGPAVGLSPAAEGGLAQLEDRLRRARRRVEQGSGPAGPLWELWQGSAWAAALADDLGRGPAQARAADRQLDLICALFDLAHGLSHSGGPAGVAALIDQVARQEIPHRSGRSEVGREGLAVLTAHRAKGRQWRAVVVAGVCEGVWPSLRSARELIDLTDLSPDGRFAPLGPTEQLAAERRLFYVACTRASHALLVTAVDQNQDQGLRPSRLIDQLGGPTAPAEPAEAAWSGLNQLVGGLRRACLDPTAHPSLRQAAAARLADLAGRRDPVSGRPLVRLADPARWWPVGQDCPDGDDDGRAGRAEPAVRPGFERPSPAAWSPERGGADWAGPLRGAGRSALDQSSESGRPSPAEGGDGPWRLTGSHLRALLTCPRQWFLDRRVKAAGPPGPAAAVGALVHQLVHDLGRGLIDRSQADQRLERDWPQIDFPARWRAEAERQAAGQALDRFENWRDGQGDWRLIGLEVPFELNLTVGSQLFQLVGRIDRIDQDAAGRIRVVDFKTARQAITAAQAAADDQLGIYQLAVRGGALADSTGPNPSLAAAELVYLRCPAGPGGAWPTLRRQPSLDQSPQRQQSQPVQGLSPAGATRVGPARTWPSWVHHRLAWAGRLMAEGRFPALPQAGCAWCHFKASCPAGPSQVEDA